MDNLVIFSVNQNCIKQKMTTFEVPAKMPKCTGDHCICESNEESSFFVRRRLANSFFPFLFFSFRLMALACQSRYRQLLSDWFPM